MVMKVGFLAGILQPIFGPFLYLGPFWAILLISFLLTLIVTVIYKYTTNQKLMKSLKDELKKLQKELKKLKDQPNKMMKKQKVLMAKNMEYMKHSFRATLFTIIPVIIVFGWLSANLAYEPLVETKPFNVTLVLAKEPSVPPKVELPDGVRLIEGYPRKSDNKVVYGLTAQAGTYEAPPLRFVYNGNICEVPLIVVSPGGRGYANPRVDCKAGDIQKAVISNKELKPLGNLSVFGWRPGWFGTYIVLSLVFSMLLRKLLKVY